MGSERRPLVHGSQCLRPAQCSGTDHFLLLEDTLPTGIQTVREKWTTESLYYQNIGAPSSCLPEKGKNCSAIKNQLKHLLFTTCYQKQRGERRKGGEWIKIYSSIKTILKKKTEKYKSCCGQDVSSQ